MTQLKRYAAVSICLGVVSVIGLLPVHLALVDIWRGETDVALEWTVVRIGILTILAFQISALLTLLKLVRVGGRW
jgi:hypothetical protein